MIDEGFRKFLDTGKEFRKKAAEQLLLKNINKSIRVKKKKFNPKQYNKQLRRMR